MTKERADLRLKLLEEVLEQIKKDIDSGDVESILELLNFCTTINLMYYLPEDDWSKYEEIKHM